MPKPRLLILCRYTHLGASSRLRFYQYVPALEKAGIDVTVSPLFDDSYLKTLDGTGRRHPTELLRSYADRLATLRSGTSYDLIWIEKEVFPFIAGHFDVWCLPQKTPYVIDYDDATFHRYDQHDSRWIRLLLGSKLHPLLKSASAVIAGNTYLADYAERAGAPEVEIVPTVVDINRYAAAPTPTSTEELRVCWIGSSSTTPYLGLIKEPLQALSRMVPIRLVTIGAGELPMRDVPTEQHQWSEQTEATLLSGCHLGIMPLADGPWERGKCGYKLIQYMACGLPVIASPVGVNQEIVTPNNGFLCHEDTNWLDALRALACDPALRRRLGQAGRRSAQEHYSLQVQAPIIIDILRAALDTSR